MPDYIYLLENRLSPAQQAALQSIREAARDAGMTVFLTGGAVRDLTSGSPVRDLDLSVQGNAFELKDRLKRAGAVLWGEHAPSQTIFARFPGSVRVEVSSTRREEFPKPGKPVYHPGSILEDLRRRDFTANAMALSLNEGSYGLLMDPLNGVADLEARALRLVSNYGFIEDPVRLIRAARLQARLGWELEEKTKSRFETAKEEGYVAQISGNQQGYEVEEIVHEEDGLKILKVLEADGWMKALFPLWTSAKVDVEALETLRELLVQLQMQGVNPDPSAAQAQLLTAKLAPKDLASLKKMFVRQGFVREWASQEERAKEFGKRLTGKEATTPSAAWKLFTSADPEAILWLGLTSKSAPVQAKFNEFFNVWPEARQRIPYTIMQEMRITPEIEGYQDLLKSIFFELIDGKLVSEEEIRQFLGPYSPPAPPPPVTIRRPRAKKLAEKTKEAKGIDDEEVGDARAGHDDEDADDEETGDDEVEREELIVRPIRPIASIPEPRVPVTDQVENQAHEVAPKAPAEEKPAPASVSHAGKPAVFAKKLTVKEKPEPKAKPKTETVSAPAHVAKKSAPVAAKGVVKPAAKVPAKSAGKAATLKPAAKSGSKTASKSAAKGKASAAAAGKAKPAVKKAAVKPAIKSKLRKVVLTKPKPAKAIVKPKAALSKVKPATKSKTSSKTSVKAVKASGKKKR